MTFKIEYIATFRADVLNIEIHLEEHPQKARRIFKELDEKLGVLAKNPKMYQVYEDFPIFRRIVVEDYLAFYTIDEKRGIIEIHRLICGKMDVSEQLGAAFD